MKNAFKLAIKLLIICVISAGALALVYNKTQPVIEEMKRKKLKSNLRSVFKNAVRFETIKEDTLWHAFDESDSLIGIAFKAYPRGYGGPIETLVGVKLDGKITGIIIASPSEGLKETPGLGLKVREKWFTDQFVEKKKEDLLLKKDGGTLDAITAATISSRAVVRGVADGLERYLK